MRRPNDPNWKILGQKIRQLRHERNLSQEDLAGLASFHRNFIVLIEQGERNVTLRTLFALAAALEVHPAQLFEGCDFDGSPAKSSPSD